DGECFLSLPVFLSCSALEIIRGVATMIIAPLFSILPRSRNRIRAYELVVSHSSHTTSMSTHLQRPAPGSSLVPGGAADIVLRRARACRARPGVATAS